MYQVVVEKKANDILAKNYICEDVTFKISASKSLKSNTLVSNTMLKKYPIFIKINRDEKSNKLSITLSIHRLIYEVATKKEISINKKSLNLSIYHKTNDEYIHFKIDKYEDGKAIFLEKKLIIKIDAYTKIRDYLSYKVGANILINYDLANNLSDNRNIDSDFKTRTLKNIDIFLTDKSFKEDVNNSSATVVKEFFVTYFKFNQLKQNMPWNHIGYSQSFIETNQHNKKIIYDYPELKNPIFDSINFYNQNNKLNITNKLEYTLEKNGPLSYTFNYFLNDSYIFSKETQDFLKIKSYNNSIKEGFYIPSHFNGIINLKLNSNFKLWNEKINDYTLNICNPLFNIENKGLIKLNISTIKTLNLDNFFDNWTKANNLKA
ncbi:hypothetical protein DSL60_01020 [Metamycoplasma hominis]|uniref:MHO_1580 family protein n=1 Tax=Metamycoplasma hominis TaxID=2098 RepID=UPI000DEDB617|nr:hypothetical protein [Metamycoplasma hominis]RCJ00988.1 hypothetical protein DSL60_01020 [Metamycoplasma hominis]